jgi:hypothetical protein
MALIKVEKDDIDLETPLHEVADEQERERLLWRKMSRVQHVLVYNVGEALELIDDLVEGGAIERFECASLELFIEKYLHLRPEALDQLKAGYAQLRAQGVAGPVSQQQAMTAGQRVEAAAGTARATSQGERSDTSQILRGQKQRAEEAGVSVYTQRKLDRLARERPDLLEAVKTGRLSAHAAAVEAKIVKQREPDPFDELCRWWDRADEERRARFETYQQIARRKDVA